MKDNPELDFASASSEPADKPAETRRPSGTKAADARKVSDRGTDTRKASKSAKSANRKLTETEKLICENLSFAAKEAYKKLRTNVLVALTDLEYTPVIGVTSAQPAEGKSITSLNLAWSLAEMGKRVILVDGDLRRASIHEKLSLSQSPGLSNLLTGDNAISNSIRTHSDGRCNLDVICGGGYSENASELLGSQRMVKILDLLRSAYDYIVLDLPPVGAVTDAVTLASALDGMLVVIRENNCPRPLFASCIEQLNFAGIKVLGFVVNGSRDGTNKSYSYDYSHYGYY